MPKPSHVTQVLNLHDAFLNASLVRDLMLKQPLVSEVEVLHATDRIRMERLWVALLAVLVESWRSKSMGEARAYIAKVVDTAGLDQLLARGEQTGELSRLVDCRHYMFHRDRREYWDPGRLASVGQLEFNNNLHMAYSGVLLAALRSLHTPPHQPTSKER